MPQIKVDSDSFEESAVKSFDESDVYDRDRASNATDPGTFYFEETVQIVQSKGATAERHGYGLVWPWWADIGSFPGWPNESDSYGMPRMFGRRHQAWEFTPDVRQVPWSGSITGWEQNDMTKWSGNVTTTSGGESWEEHVTAGGFVGYEVISDVYDVSESGAAVTVTKDTTWGYPDGEGGYLYYATEHWTCTYSEEVTTGQTILAAGGIYTETPFGKWRTKTDDGYTETDTTPYTFGHTVDFGYGFFDTSGEGISFTFAGAKYLIFAKDWYISTSVYDVERLTVVSGPTNTPQAPHYSNEFIEFHATMNFAWSIPVLGVP